MDVPDRMAPQTSGLCGTEAREAPQPRGEETPPPPSAAAVTPTQVCCRHFFSVFGASATCWHPGLRAPWAPSVPLSTPGTPILTASWVTPGADGPLRPGPRAPFPLR